MKTIVPGTLAKSPFEFGVMRTSSTLFSLLAARNFFDVIDWKATRYRGFFSSVDT